MENEIKIKVGDKVIRADGLAGKVVELYDEEKILFALVKYENGTHSSIGEKDYLMDYKSYYLIGTTILGNKRPIEELDDRIADTHMEIERLKAEEKQLRKQRWRLQYQMNGDYKLQNEQKVKQETKTITDAGMAKANRIMNDESEKCATQMNLNSEGSKPTLSKGKVEEHTGGTRDE